MGAFSGPREWGRLLTAMITPFDEREEVNLPEARRIAAHLVDDQQNTGLVISGTTGESPTLSRQEKLALLESTLAEVGTRAAVVFGAGTYDTRESVHLAQEAERIGAHGIMVVSPYYSRPGQEGLYAHYAAIADSVSLPVLVYNIQGRTSINLETPTLRRLQSIGNIVAVKEASGNISQIVEVAATAPEGFRVYSGDDGITLPVMSIGGFGVVSVAGHIVGQQLRRLVEVFGEDPAEARRLHEETLPTVQALFHAPNPVPVKYALSLRGFNCERVRLPLVPLAEPMKSELRAVASRYLA